MSATKVSPSHRTISRPMTSRRTRYYGRAAYDFGEVPLADVGAALRARGKTADALRFYVLNTELTQRRPSPSAKRPKRSSPRVTPPRRFEASSARSRSIRTIVRQKALWRSSARSRERIVILSEAKDLHCCNVKSRSLVAVFLGMT